MVEQTSTCWAGASRSTLAQFGESGSRGHITRDGMDGLYGHALGGAQVALVHPDARGGAVRGGTRVDAPAPGRGEGPWSAARDAYGGQDGVEAVAACGGILLTGTDPLGHGCDQPHRARADALLHPDV